MAVTPEQPDFTSQDSSTLKNNLEKGHIVSSRLSWAFAPHEQDTPDMTVRVDAGFIFDGTLAEVDAQDTD
ncbi:MAG: hypothetical protein ACOCUM_00275, partial [Thiohalospira sp.]